jgi:predicted permease
MMAVGWTAKMAQVLNAKLIADINVVVFHVLMPILLFTQIYKLDFGRDVKLSLMLFVFAALSLLVLLLVMAVPWFEHDRARAGAMIQAMFRGNIMMFGISISSAIYDISSVGRTVIVLASIVPFFNIVSVIVLDYFRQSIPDTKEIFTDVLKTPCIIAAIAALSLRLIGARLPGLVLEAADEIAAATTPVALISLGGSFTLSGFMKYKTQLAAGCLVKMIVVPVIMLFSGALLGFRDNDLVAILSVSATPTAVSAFSAAQELGSDGELSAQLVIATSAVSVLTLFTLVFALDTLQLI